MEILANPTPKYMKQGIWFANGLLILCAAIQGIAQPPAAKKGASPVPPRPKRPNRIRRTLPRNPLAQAASTSLKLFHCLLKAQRTAHARTIFPRATIGLFPPPTSRS